MQNEATETPALFGMTESDLSRRGALVTAREIAQQPRLWWALADVLEERSDEIAAFLEAPMRRENLLVVFTGAGTSAFAGGIAAAEAMAAGGRETRRMPTTDLVENWACHLDPARPILVVSFARSGDSPESVAALEIVDRNCAEVWHLVLTCNPDGALARSAVDGGRRFRIVMPDGSCDQGFAMTGSFTTMTLAALAIFASAAPGAGVSTIRRLADSGSEMLAQWPKAAALAARRHDRIVYLGGGALADAANECALKLLELTDGEAIASAFSPLAFRHGPKTIISGPNTLAVHLVAGNATVRRYGVDLLAELAREGRADLFALLPNAREPTVAVPSVGVAGGETLPGDAWLAAPYVVFAQMLALFASLARGLKTDAPSRSGEVSRVVRNVTIHA